MFKESVPFTKRIKEAIHPTPLRQRVMESLFKLKTQLRRLEKTSSHIQQRDGALYKKCIDAMQSKNHELASMYANECAEIRKMAKVILHSELALEQVTLRLETVQQFGDIAYTMRPVAGVVKTIRNQLQSVLPEVSLELAEVNESLEYLVVEVGEATDSSFDVNASSEEAQRILSEANVVAEQKMKERFPDLPAIPTHEARI